MDKDNKLICQCCGMPLDENTFSVEPLREISFLSK